MRRCLWVVAAAAFVAVIAWTAGVGGPSTGSGGSVPRAGDRQQGLDIEPGLDLYSGGQRLPAPPLVGTNLDGRQFSLAELHGTVVVINVWGS